MLSITGEMTIYRAAELKEQVLQALAESTGDLEIDLSGVSELDVSGVQVLMLAKKTALQQERILRLTAHSPAVVEVFQILNVAAYFGDPLVITESA